MTTLCLADYTDAEEAVLALLEASCKGFNDSQIQRVIQFVSDEFDAGKSPAKILSEARQLARNSK